MFNVSTLSEDERLLRREDRVMIRINSYPLMWIKKINYLKFWVLVIEHAGPRTLLGESKDDLKRSQTLSKIYTRGSLDKTE